jgi:hypothetical protein
MTIPVAYNYPADARYLDLPGVLQGSLSSSVCLVRSGSGSSEAPILNTVQPLSVLCEVVGLSQKNIGKKEKNSFHSHREYLRLGDSPYGNDLGNKIHVIFVFLIFHLIDSLFTVPQNGRD